MAVLTAFAPAPSSLAPVGPVVAPDTGAAPHDTAPR
jgi:hypothetical protein